MKSKNDSFRMRRTLPGLAASRRVQFVAEARGDPLGAYPALQLESVPFNRWVTERILDPILERWSHPRRRGGALREAVMNEVEWGSGRIRLAFQEILPGASALGEPAVLAAMGVAANALRTIALLGEFMLDEGPPPALPVFRLSRLWCGLIDYPKNSDYFVARVRRPTPPKRLRAHRQDCGHLRNAFWCSSREIESRCAESILVLREEIRRIGLFTPEDLRHLHGASIPGRVGRRED